MTAKERGVVRRVRRLVAVFCLVAAASYAVQAAQRAADKSFLWKVQNGSSLLYAAGSVHALDRSVYPLSAAFEQAFAASTALVEEIDMADRNTLAAAPMMLGRGMFQDGRTLDKVISRDTYTLLAAHLKDMPMGMGLFNTMKPWMVDMMLTALEVQRAGLDPTLGLDKHFYDRAVTAGKEIIALETAESQIDRLDALPMDVQEQLLRSTVRGLDSTKASLASIVTAWKRGDAAGLEKMLLSEFDGFPAVYQSLVVERNRNWMPALDACLARRSPCLVVVGAAHLVGPDGILALLQRKGYRVEQQ